MFARTFYFEYMEQLGGDQWLIIPVLQKLENNEELTYYKHVQYGLCMVFKHVGIIQFKERTNENMLRRLFADGKIHLEILDRVSLPLVLPHVKIWLLAKHHGVEGEINEEGVYSLGGKCSSVYSRRRQLENNMRPYKTVLTMYMANGTICQETTLKNIEQLVSYADALGRLTNEYI
jgi:hypothetical protein